MACFNDPICLLRDAYQDLLQFLLRNVSSFVSVSNQYISHLLIQWYDGNVGCRTVCRFYWNDSPCQTYSRKIIQNIHKL